MHHANTLVLIRTLFMGPPQEVEVGAARKVFDLRLEELGPYNLSFTRSGRHLLLGGRKGHLALLDWQRASIVTELQASLWAACYGTV